jgi:hypothetical protein
MTLSAAAAAALSWTLQLVSCRRYELAMTTQA